MKKESPASARTAQTLYPRRVLSNRELGPAVHLLRFERDRDAFVPGQIVAVRVGPVVEPRLYSLVNAEKAAAFEILFEVRPEGALTPCLRDCVAGSMLEVSSPLGGFTDRPGPAWWIAGGTGIAPFWSMVRSGQGAQKTLLHAASATNGFYGAEDFAARQGLRYIRCCSRATGEDPDIFPGRVTQWLKEHPAPPQGCPVMICGSAGFVVAVRETLLNRGIAPENLQAEIYF